MAWDARKLPGSNGEANQSPVGGGSTVLLGGGWMPTVDSDLRSEMADQDGGEGSGLRWMHAVGCGVAEKVEKL